MAPYAKKLLMVRGIRSMNEWSFKGTDGQKNDPHTQPCGSFFTCQPVTPRQRREVRPPSRPAARWTTSPPSRSTRTGGALRCSCRSAACSGNAHNTQAVISWSTAQADLPGRRLADADLQQPHEPLRQRARDAGHLRGGQRQEHHRLVRDDLSSLQGVNDERGGQAEAERLDRASPLDVRRTVDRAAHVQRRRLGRRARHLGAGDGGDRRRHLEDQRTSCMDLAVLTALCDTQPRDLHEDAARTTCSRT